MQRILISFALCLCFFTAKAQLSHPHFISVNIGTNIPLADYKEVEDIEIGSADLGLSYSFEGGAYFSKVLGVGLHLGVFENGMDEDDIKDFQNLVNNGVTIDDLDVSADKWVNGFFMIGPYLSFGGKKVVVDLKLLGGFLNSAKPSINIQNINDLDRISEEVSANAFGINYGMHLRIKLVGKLGLRINAEGFQAKQEFESRVKEIDNNGNSVNIDKEIKKEINALNLGIGAIITF